MSPHYPSAWQRRVLADQRQGRYPEMTMNQADYRVDLDVYNGPLELLLYLIRKEEVDIHDIPIARITAQYLAHVELIRRIDINLAGDFLVMAATLMEIKSRMLNPRPPADPTDPAAASADGTMDPRRQLVEQLLQYKQFKDAANSLQRRNEAELCRFPRGTPRGTARVPLDLEDVNLFVLMDAFNAIMASVGHTAFGHDVVLDDTPISLHQADIMDRLERDGPVTLKALLAGRKSRGEMIGLFLAMLELMRLKKLIIEQTTPAGELVLKLRPEAPEPLEPGPAAETMPDPELANQRSAAEVPEIQDNNSDPHG